MTKKLTYDRCIEDTNKLLTYWGQKRIGTIHLKQNKYPIKMFHFKPNEYGKEIGLNKTPEGLLVDILWWVEQQCESRIKEV